VVGTLRQAQAIGMAPDLGSAGEQILLTACIVGVANAVGMVSRRAYREALDDKAMELLARSARHSTAGSAALVSYLDNTAGGVIGP
jgi:hypothetical protein